MVEPRLSIEKLSTTLVPTEQVNDWKCYFCATSERTTPRKASMWIALSQLLYILYKLRFTCQTSFLNPRLSQSKATTIALQFIERTGLRLEPARHAWVGRMFGTVSVCSTNTKNTMQQHNGHSTARVITIQGIYMGE